ncbi:MAG: FdrA family protein, partial [Eubacteriales bacterium]|nr:FdrA family protein [Eubacteriales bacterium]
MIKLEVKKNAYFDSVTLMLISKELKKVEGVTEALVGMGSDLNKEIAHNIGVATPELTSAVSANDFFIAVSCAGEEAFAAVLKKTDELLNKKAESKGAAYAPPTLDG